MGEIQNNALDRPEMQKGFQHRQHHTCRTFCDEVAAREDHRFGSPCPQFRSSTYAHERSKFGLYRSQYRADLASSGFDAGFGKARTVLDGPASQVHVGGAGVEQLDPLRGTGTGTGRVREDLVQQDRGVAGDNAEAAACTARRDATA